MTLPWWWKSEKEIFLGGALLLPILLADICIWKVNVLRRYGLGQPNTVAAQKKLVPVLVHLLGSNPEDHRVATPAPDCFGGFSIQGKMNVVPFALAQAIGTDGGQIAVCGAMVQVVGWRSFLQVQADRKCMALTSPDPGPVMVNFKSLLVVFGHHTLENDTGEATFPAATGG
ncbi:MAG: hypothetical protein A2Y80_01055 [Deltaproteobacteria bacterium RBG_13_58_19]|nr:MAG: hypothetical protein A2Y80_01055 [Deltaproteobacteria bacterium RBG_13_58_19]